MKRIYDNVSYEVSRSVTNTYSTSFSFGIKCLQEDLRDPVYGIYGFVRLADEIVDSFHSYNKLQLLLDFKADTFKAIKEGISLNPVLNSFQHVVNSYAIGHDLINLFFKSMEMDLKKKDYDQDCYKEYILGSAESVGLMCLRVFVKGNEAEYHRLKNFARKLGSAFQKVNFLRDMNSDYVLLGRVYFPGISMDNFDLVTKRKIEEDIESDFKVAFEGIKLLPRGSRLGVYVAYIYYRGLFNKIKRCAPEKIMLRRIRIPNNQKLSMLVSSYVKHSFDLI